MNKPRRPSINTYSHAVKMNLCLFSVSVSDIICESPSEEIIDTIKTPGGFHQSAPPAMSLMKALDSQDRQETERILRDTPKEVAVRDADGRVALHYAAETMDTEIFQEIYNQDPTLVDCQDNEGLTPLIMAVMKGRNDLIEFLLEKGANLNHVDREGHSVIHWAVVCGQLDVLVLLLTKGADVLVADHEVACPLHYATAADDLPHELSLSILHTLLRGGAPVDCRDKDDRTPIHWSASNGNLEAMMSLKQAGGDIQVVDRDQLAVIHCAASHGYHEIVDYYMECVPRQMVNVRDRSGASALFYAVSFGHYEVARKLLTYGALPNLQDNRLRTASHCGAAKGQLRMLKLLRQYNASFEIQNYKGDLPLHEAVQADCKDVVEWLLALHPTSIDAASHEGRTCLHLAAARGTIEMVVLLCTKGAFVDPLMLFSDKLFTPLDLAEKKDHQVVVDYLRSRKAQRSADLDEETRNNSKTTFEERMVAAQLAHSNPILFTESSTDPKVEEIVKETANAAVNTTARRSSGAFVTKLGKTTSTSELDDAEDLKRQVKDKEMAEREKAAEDAEQIMRRIIREEVQQELNGKSLASGAVLDKVEEAVPNHEDDYYAEDLPGISDSSEEEEEHQENDDVFDTSGNTLKSNDSKENKENGIEKEQVVEKSKSSRMVSGKANKRTEKAIKAVRIARETDADGEESGDDKHEEQRPTKKQVQEKNIFQELTHLKRMQIQYGKVQEKVLVRSLVSNFCKMHGLDPAHYKFSTFYAWEKFLYDQLKIIYLDERTRLTHVRDSRLDRFETRLRAARAVPLNDKVTRMSRVYGSGAMTSGKSAKPREKSAGATEKRCNCLGKHLLIQGK